MERFNCSELNAVFNTTGPDYILIEKSNQDKEQKIKPKNTKKECSIKLDKKNEIRSIIAKSSDRIIYSNETSNEYEDLLDSYVQNYINEAQNEQSSIMLQHDIEYINSYFIRINERSKEDEIIIIKKHLGSSFISKNAQKCKNVNWKT